MQERFDIAIIGGGVVGLAILRRMSMAGYRCLLLERGADILSGASKGNSALLHTGFDAPSESLELTCMKAGCEEYRAIAAKLNLPLLETGAVVVGWTAEEAEKLPAIVAKAHKNGVSDVRLMSATELRIREPGLSRAAREAVLVPGEHVIDPWSAPLAYAHQALSCGATIERGCALTGADFAKGHWQLRAGDRVFAAETVINAAGLFGDWVEQFARTPGFSIRPRKGQFVVFDKPAARLVRSIILPVPTERTKGVVLFRTIFGNLAIGPTAEDTQERESASCDQPTLENLKARAIAMAPGLANIGVNAIYAGLRPATEHQDYVIEALPDKQWITVAGIRSTGLTGSLGIAQHVEKLQRKHFGKPKAKPPKVAWPSMPNLAEHRIRPYQKGGEIICHCEWVTRSEIEAALQGPLPARDLGGLKRRTRAMMGRCQGFNCGAEVRCMLEKAGHGTA